MRSKWKPPRPGWEPSPWVPVRRMPRSWPALPPGSYTAVAKGVDETTGVALVEVYVVTDNQRPTAVQ